MCIVTVTGSITAGSMEVPAGMWPCLRITKNGYTKEVRLNSYGEKELDPTLEMLKKRYGFAFYSRNHVVTLMAFGYHIYAKSTTKW